jgi:hypothetical protein
VSSNPKGSRERCLTATREPQQWQRHEIYYLPTMPLLISFRTSCNACTHFSCYIHSLRAGRQPNQSHRPKYSRRMPVTRPLPQHRSSIQTAGTIDSPVRANRRKSDLTTDCERSYSGNSIIEPLISIDPSSQNRCD